MSDEDLHDRLFHGGWHVGVQGAINAVRARRAYYELYRAQENDDLQLAHVAMRTHPATFAVLDEIIVMLEAALARGTYTSTSDLE